MKKHIILSSIAFVILLLPVMVLGAKIPDQIILGLKSGNAKTISAYFNENIELVILEKENICSKAQAEQILRDFFNKNKPSGFTLIHQGGEETASYAVGNYESGTNSYRVYLLLKRKGGKSLIHQLRIEKE
jgi:hypothetical protein